jgi:hypothetical protein
MSRHRHNRIDRALRLENPWMWIATFAVLILGIVLILLAVVPGNRGRQQAVDRVQVGEPGERATEVIGLEPRRCPADDLGHLRNSFAEGWPQAAVDVALEELERLTTERWVYAESAQAVAGCEARPGQTEVGIGEDGTVVWTLPVFGRSALRTPPWLTPAGVSD